jgi:hypothetical protein
LEVKLVAVAVAVAAAAAVVFVVFLLNAVFDESWELF